MNVGIVFRHSMWAQWLFHEHLKRVCTVFCPWLEALQTLGLSVGFSVVQSSSRGKNAD